MSNAALAALTEQLILSLNPSIQLERPSVLSSKREQIVRRIRSDALGGSRKVWEDVSPSLAGLARTARIRVQHDLGDGLDKAVGCLEGLRERGSTGWEGDMIIKISNLPQHIQFLLNLSDRPTAATHQFAHSYLTRLPETGPTPDQILYNEIMNSAPFTGDHWGAGYDDEVKEGWTDSDSSSDISAEDEEILTPSSRKGKAGLVAPITDPRLSTEEARMLDAQESLRRLGRDAYWRNCGVEVDLSVDLGYGWREVSLAQAPGVGGSSKVITAAQFQRELIFALSGRSGIFYTLQPDGQCIVTRNHPGVRQYTSTALAGILDEFRSRAEQASSIRAFISESLSPAAANIGPSTGTPRPSQTTQAFAEACRQYIEDLDNWLAELEACFTVGSTQAGSSLSVPGVSAATTPLILRLEFDTRFGETLRILSGLISHTDNPTILLNTLYTTIISLQSACGDLKTLSTLLDIFIKSTTPVWNMLGDWVIRGMPVPTSLLSAAVQYTSSSNLIDIERGLSSEFFIKRDRDVSWADEDFWESGYIDDEVGWPVWLDHDGLREAIMEGGKARGLLRSLVGLDGEEIDGWKSLAEVGLPSHRESRNNETADIARKALQIPNIASGIFDFISPISQIAQVKLRQVLGEDCGLQQHLDAIEGVMYMRAFEVMDEWVEWLFVQMQSQLPWTDFQVLTSSFRDTVDRSSAVWLNPSAVRIRTSRRVGNSKDISSLSSIRADYQVPFPLSQLFSSTSIELRAQVFSFLLQMQRARKTLISTRLLDGQCAPGSIGGNTEGRVIWHVRQRLAWGIDAIWVWITERVIELETRAYRGQLEATSSFRAMISLELEHTRKIRDFCFLHEKTSTLHSAVMSLLNMTTTLTECYATYVSDLENGTKRTFAVERRSREASRDRKRSQRFATDDTSDEDDDVHETQESVYDITIRQAAQQALYMDVGVVQRMEMLDDELRAKVAVIRSEVDRLAGDDGNSGMEGNAIRATWGILGFALESDGWRV